MRDSVKSGLDSHHPASRWRWIDGNCCGGRAAIMQRGQAEKAKMRADIEQRHSSLTLSNEAVELYNLIRIILLCKIRKAEGGRMMDEKPTRAKFHGFVPSHSELKLIPQPARRLPWRPQPIANASWNEKSSRSLQQVHLCQPFEGFIDPGTSILFRGPQ